MRQPWAANDEMGDPSEPLPDNTGASGAEGAMDAAAPPAAAAKDRVRVCVRVRPLSGDGETRAVTAAGAKIVLGGTHAGERSFAFDGVFGEAATQQEVRAPRRRLFDGREDDAVRSVGSDALGQPAAGRAGA